MGPFIDVDFLLENRTARKLYEGYAEAQPIIDYHCHIRPKTSPRIGDFALFEVWLEGDHYKWRAMRANGVDARYCTGDAKPYEKFIAWAKPYTLRNPVPGNLLRKCCGASPIPEKMTKQNAIAFVGTRQ
jgi:glucuronate isomerase